MKTLPRFALLISLLATIPSPLCAQPSEATTGTSRNNVVQAKGLPSEWDIGKFDRKTGAWQPSGDKQIRWVSRLGDECYGSPVVADGKVFVATNNAAGYLKRYPAKTDLGCLLCFAVADGKFLWQLSREKLPGGENVDWPGQGICNAPLVEGKRLWIVTNRCEVMCLDTEGFRDGKNDGPATDEPIKADDEADVIWSFDMAGKLGVVPRYMTCCTVAAAGDLLLVCTSNGADIKEKVPAPNAPSFIALDKHTGELVWADASPGANILEGQWSSPAWGVLGGVKQAIFGGGDGWVYSFLAEPTPDGKAKLLWKFDCNAKDLVWEAAGSSRRNYIVATPVIHDGRVYIATGQDPQYGEGTAVLWCIDPTKRGDVSPELVVDKDGKPVAPQRLRAMDADAGDKTKPNPNSAVVWRYRGSAADPEKGDFKQVMHRALASVTIADDLLVIGDLSGLVHCLDPKTGKVHWTHDLQAELWGNALVADGKIYIGTSEGEVVVLALGKEPKVLAKNDVGNSMHTTPVVAGGVLYVSTKSNLIAIGSKK